MIIFYVIGRGELLCERVAYRAQRVFFLTNLQRYAR